MTHSCVWHGSCISVTWLNQMRAMTHSCAWHGSFTCVPWLIHMWDNIYYSFICETTYITNETYLRNESCLDETWLNLTRDMTQSNAWHDSHILRMRHICESCLIYTPSSAWHDSSTYVDATHCNTLQHTATHCNTLQHTATHYICNMTQSNAWHDSFTYAPELCTLHTIISRFSPRTLCRSVRWLIRLCAIICSYMWYDAVFMCHDSSIRVIRLDHMCAMTHFICVTWLIHVCDMTRSCVWHDSSICVPWLIHMCGLTVWRDCYMYVIWLIHMCGMTHSYVWHASFICVTWLSHTCNMT